MTGQVNKMEYSPRSRPVPVTLGYTSLAYHDIAGLGHVWGQQVKTTIAITSCIDCIDHGSRGQNAHRSGYYDFRILSTNAVNSYMPLIVTVPVCNLQHTKLEHCML
eukprot:scpid102148/ scgid9521/ 